MVNDARERASSSVTLTSLPLITLLLPSIGSSRDNFSCSELCSRESSSPGGNGCLRRTTKLSSSDPDASSYSDPDASITYFVGVFVINLWRRLIVGRCCIVVLLAKINDCSRVGHCVTDLDGGNLFAKGNQKGSKKGSGEIEPARKKESRDG